MKRENDGVISGSVRTACYRGNYHVVPLAGVDAYLLVVEDAAVAEPIIPLSCHVDNHLAVARQAQVVNETCADEGDALAGGNVEFNPTCPARTAYTMTCAFAGSGAARGAQAWASTGIALAAVMGLLLTREMMGA